jgi:WD40 repeat protein
MNANVLLKLKGHERPITNILIDDKNNLISTSKDSKLLIWEKYRTIKKVNCSGTIWFVMSDSSKLYIGTADGTFSLYDYEGNLISSYIDCGPIRYIHYDKINNIFYILSKKLLKKESVLSVLDSNLLKICDYEFDIEYNRGYFTSKKNLVCGGSDGNLTFFIFVNNKLEILKKLNLHKAEITCINEYNNILITSSFDCCLKAIDLESLQNKFTFKNTTSILSFSINKSRNLIVIGGGPDKMLISNTSDNNKFDIVLVDLLNGEKLFEIDSKHFGPINSIYFNEIDNKIITGGEDGFIHIWDCNNQWIEKYTLRYMIEQVKKIKLSISESYKLHKNVPNGKEARLKRRNLKKKIDKLENRVNIIDKKIIDYCYEHKLSKLEVLNLQ